MIELMLILQMSQLQPIMTAQIQPCKWPNKCEAPVVAQVQICVWPKKCASPAPVTAQIQPCNWPNKCAAPSLFPNG